MLRKVIKTKAGEYVLIDTRHTLDHGWESMVFRCDEDGDVFFYDEIDVAWYQSAVEAIVGHYDMVNKWKDK
jgi:hypothetical protein